MTNSTIRVVDLLAVLPEEVARALGAVAAKVVSVLHLRTPLVATQTKATAPAKEKFH